MMAAVPRESASEAHARLAEAAARAGATDGSTDEASDVRVAALVEAMTPEEKYGMLNGVGWDGWDLREGYHVGTLPGVSRLGVPSPRANFTVSSRCDFLLRGAKRACP